MKRKSYGGLVVILLVSIIAFGFGAVFGAAHIGEEFSKEILPTSLTTSSDIVQVIDEKSFEPANITIKFQTQTTVKKVNKTSYNYTNRSTDRNSSGKKKSNSSDSGKKKTNSSGN